MRPSLIPTIIPGGVAVTIAEQPIERSGSDNASRIPLRVTQAGFGMLRPHVGEPPARELIEGDVGEKRSTLMRHIKAF